MTTPSNPTRTPGSHSGADPSSKSDIVDIPDKRTGPSESAMTHTPRQPNSSHRWWLAVVIASIVALPIGWILSYAAALPFMIGTFFFALLGLIIGAIAFRAARANRPYTQAMIILGTSVIVLVGWGYSIHVEARSIPVVLAERAADNTRDIGDLTRDQFEASVAQNVRNYLTANFAPGGTLGYIRWVVTDGTIPAAEIPRARRPQSWKPTGWIWLVRAALSLGLFAFGVASQTLALAKDA